MEKPVNDDVNQSNGVTPEQQQQQKLIENEINAIQAAAENLEKQVIENARKKEEDTNEKIAKMNAAANRYNFLTKVSLYTFAMSILSQGINVTLSATEITADIGSSLPVVGIALVLVDRLAKQYKASVELHDILEDIQVSLLACDKLIKLIVFTTNTFNEYYKNYIQVISTQLVDNINKNENITCDQNNVDKKIVDLVTDKLKAFINTKINAAIEIKIKAKISIINLILEEIDSGFIKKAPEQSSAPVSYFNSLKIKGTNLLKRSYKFFIPNDYKRRILNALNIINNLLIVYNSQFDWVIRANERFLKDITIPISKIITTKNDNKQNNTIVPVSNIPDKCVNGNIEILELIWNAIESSAEFKSYLIHEDDTNAVTSPSTAIKSGGKKTKRRNRKSNKQYTKLNRRWNTNGHKKKMKRRNTMKISV